MGPSTSFKGVFAMNNEQARIAIDRYQKEVRMVQLQNLAARALNRQEAQRHLAEYALLEATLNF